MKTVLKYEIGPGVTLLQLPLGADPLHAGEQNDKMFLWALVDLEMAKRDYQIEVYPTGHDVENGEELHHVGTVQQASGLVWHVFVRWS